MRRAALTVLGGLLLCFSLPPWGWWPLAFASIVLLDFALADRSAATRFRTGFGFGLAWLAPATLWMWDFTAPGWFAAVGFMSALVGVATALTPGRAPLRWLALPVALVLVEFVRSIIPFGGVPLATIAMSQSSSPLAPLARIGGGSLLTWAVGVVGVLGASVAVRHRRAAATSMASLAVVITITGLVPRSEPIERLRVAVVQGGGPQQTRAATSDAGAVLDRHIEATKLIDQPVDVVVWPENVLVVDRPLPESPQGARLADLAREIDSPIIVGSVGRISADAFTNYSQVVLPSGRFADRYDKVQRVPFGEYIPLRGLVDVLSGGTASRFVPRDAVAGTGPATIDTPGATFGIVISWEVFFERRARDAIGNGGTVLLNPTNGSSYWLTIVQSQQVAASQLRAIETDRATLQAAPTGFSAVIDPDGNVIERSGVSEQRILYATIEQRTGLTPAVRFGPWPWLALSIVALGAAWILGPRFSPEPIEPGEPMTTPAAPAHTPYGPPTSLRPRPDRSASTAD